MSTTDESPAATPPEGAPGPAVSARRIGPRRYLGRTPRGVEIPIGHGDGEASPRELLQLALAGCAGMSADHAIARRLGEDAEVEILARAERDEPGNRIAAVDEELRLDLSGLPAAERERLVAVVQKAIEVGCTIERTLTAGAAVHHRITDESAGPA